MHTRLPAILVAMALAGVLALAGAFGLATDSSESTGPVRQVRAAADPVVPGDGRDISALITSLQQTLRRVPRDDRSWATLAIAYVEQARTTGDVTLYAKADRAVQKSLAIAPVDNFSALAARAAVDAARHDFSSALAEADESLAIDPYGVGALALRIDALTELGQYDEQLAALKEADARRPGVPIAARYSYAYELRGDLGRAGNILRTASDAASVADKAFLLTLLANVERRQGRFAAADADLREATRVSPQYLPALVSQARLAVAGGDLNGALALWRTVVARYPVPEYLTELGELYLHLGRPALARQQFGVVDATIELLRASGVNADLETALYEADHGEPQQGVKAAQEEWARRKSIHVADVLAWSLHQAGDDRAALVLARKATRLNTPEAILWIHRGTIEAALGLNEEARTHLRRGLALDLGLSPWQVDRARIVLNKLGA